MSLGKDGLSNSVGDVPNVGSPLQAGCPVLPRADTDMLIKVIHPLYQSSYYHLMFVGVFSYSFSFFNFLPIPLSLGLILPASCIFHDLLTYESFLYF